MRLLPFGLVAAAVLAMAGRAGAAEVTDVADAFDSYKRNGLTVTNTFDANLRLWFETQTAHGVIGREPVNRPSVNTGCVGSSIRNCAPVDEVKWSSRTYWLRLQTEFGLYRDMSLSIGTAYAIEQSFQYNYADGITPQTSSVDTGANQYFELEGNGTRTKQKGWGALDFMLRYAILAEDRDDTAPSWVVGFGLSTPWLSKTYDPKNDLATSSSPAGMGDGTYRLMFNTAIAKRVFSLENGDDWESRDTETYVEPYFTLGYALPIPGPKAPIELRHSNDNPFGHAPSHIIETRIGAELVPYVNTRALRKIAVAVGGVGRFFTAGRNYSILTPALRDITYTQEYADLGGQLQLIVRISAFVHVTLGLDALYTTPHFLTNEPEGKDTNGDGVIDKPNPYFCGHTNGDKCSAASSSMDVTYDQVGTRFRDNGHLTLNWYSNVAFTF